MESLQMLQQDIESLAQSKLRITPEKFCLRGSLTADYLDSLFGMTLKHFQRKTQIPTYISSILKDLNILYVSQEDSLVRALAQPVKELDLAMNAADCGQSLQESSMKLNQSMPSSKTAQCLLNEDSVLSYQTLPKLGTMLAGIVYPLQKRVRHTSVSVFGFLLPTPVSSDASAGSVIGKNDTYYITKTGMPRKVNQNGKDGSVGLGRLVKMWPTPTAHNAKETNAPSEHTRNTPTLTAQAGGKLNTEWVEWLMGWPKGWTDITKVLVDEDFSWQKETSPRTITNCDFWPHRVKALGNGQVPICAAYAFNYLQHLSHPFPFRLI